MVKERNDQELNTLVAERLMGLIIRRSRRAGIKVSYPGTTIQYDLPDYLEDIALAWQIVERLLDLGYYTTIKPHCFYTPIAWIARVENEEAVEETLAESAPRAICLAALKAVGAIE